MKFVYPEINCVFDSDIGLINTLVIENPHFLYKLLTDIRGQIDGEHGIAVISSENNPLDWAKNAEILDVFVPFDINKKGLLSKVTSFLEKNALSPEHYEKTIMFMHDLEVYLDSLTFDFPCDIVFPKLSLSTVIKGTAPELRDEYDNLGEKILDYIEFVTEFDRSKFYITVNLRSYLNDEETELFAQTAISHGYHILMVESFSKSRFPSEKRLIIDEDLCEIG